MKKISNEQIQSLLQLFRKYNIGVNEFVAVQELFENLPKIIEENLPTVDKAEEK